MFEMPPQSLLTSPAQKTKPTAGGEAGETHCLAAVTHVRSCRDPVLQRGLVSGGPVRKRLGRGG